MVFCYSSLNIASRPSVNLLIGENQLTGEVPNIGAPSLEFFDVRFNNLEGPIPSSLFESPDSLEFVYMQGNQLTGALPANFADASSLVDLYLSSNALDGEIPDIPADSLPALTEFLLDDNEFEGSMPASVCALREDALLEDLWADCAPPAKLECACCTLCFPVPN
jgi:hypothetical protein